MLHETGMGLCDCVARDGLTVSECVCMRWGWFVGGAPCAVPALCEK